MSLKNYSPIGAAREAEENFVFHTWATVVLSLFAVAVLAFGSYLTIKEMLTGGGVNAGWAGMLTLMAFFAISYFVRESFRVTQSQPCGRPR